MRCAYSAASMGMTRKTEPVTAVMVSDLRMSRREMDIFDLRLQIPFLCLIQQIVGRPPGQRHDGQGRILVGIRDKARAVSDEQVLHIVRLAVLIKRRSGGPISHAR